MKTRERQIVKIAKRGEPIPEAAREALGARLGFRDEHLTRALSDGRVQTVVAEPTGDSGGRWFCCTCGYMAQHNMDRDAHASGRNANHAFAWFNRETLIVEEP